MKTVCVYCGSSVGTQSDYQDAAKELARCLLDQSIGLVYGGASRGLMGILADSVLGGGGSVTGVVPQALLEKEVAHRGLSELHVVDSMHERKSLMAELSDGFIAMPGGFGTLEEVVEILTWGQLQFHDKPCGLLNINGYYDDLLAFVDHATAEGFVRTEHRDMLLVAGSADRLLSMFGDYAPPVVEKWRAT